MSEDEVITGTRGAETREKLVETVLEMLVDRSPDDLRVEEVLELSGISTGSLYHHFDDFGHLVEVALIRRYVEILETAADRCWPKRSQASTQRAPSFWPFG